MSGLRSSNELSVVYGGVIRPVSIDCCAIIIFGGGGGGGGVCDDGGGSPTGQLRRVAEHLIFPAFRLDPGGREHGPSRVEVAVDTAHQRFERLRARIHSYSVPRRLGDGRRTASSCPVRLVDRRVGAD